MAGSDRLLIRVITPDHKEIVLRSCSVVLPGTVGEFGVLPGHAPFFSTLKIGAVRVTETLGEKPHWIAISGGFAEVRSDEVVVLASSAERAEEIDVRRAEAARQRAEQRLAARSPETDMARARAALMRALNRLNVARRL